MRLADLSRRLNALPGKMRRSLAAAELQTARDAKRLAIQYSSGGHSLADLARAGHPFSRSRPNSAYDPSIINRHTGLFASSWQNPTQQSTGNVIVTTVLNLSPESAYLQGTKHMVARSIGLQVMADLSAVRRRRLRSAVSATLARL